MLFANNARIKNEYKKYNVCIKPNPYIEYNINCKKNNIKRKNCDYNNNKEEAKIKACDFYEKRTKGSFNINKVNLYSYNFIKNTSNYKTYSESYKINNYSPNVIDRIDLGKILINIFKNVSSKQCISVYDSSKTNIKFKIGDDIILEKRIGKDSEYGIIYFSKFKNYKFAAKIMPVNSDNITELKINQNLAKIVLLNINPHFIINYKNFICRHPINSPEYPEYTKNNYYIMLNELANSDLYSFLPTYYSDNNILINAIQQILISILSFHMFTGYTHADCHWGNFLFLKIKPGGFVHYNIFDIDIYIENFGFIWFIWDFSFANKYDNVFDDYKRILKAFYNNKNGGWINDKYNVSDKIYDNIIKLNHIDSLYNEKKLWLYLLNNNELFKNCLNKPNNSSIINLNKPYKLF